MNDPNALSAELAHIEATLRERGHTKHADFFRRAEQLSAIDGPSALAEAREIEGFASALDDHGHHRFALPLYEACRPAFERFAPPADHGSFLMHRAIVLANLGAFAEAVAGYDQALPVLRDHAPPADYANCLVNRAAALAAQGKHADAVAGYDQALPVLRDHAPPASYARCLMNRAAALRAQGKHADAVAGYDQALPVLRDHAPPASYARCLMNRANALRAQGKHADAVAGYDQALPVLRDHAPPADYANCLMNRAAALQAQGKHADAVAGYDQALPVLRDHAPPADYARCLMNRAIALAAQGKHADAVAGYDQARRMLRGARRHAGADDTGLEFHHSYEGLFRSAVRAGLEGDLHEGAYDAVRDGKAGVVDDLAFMLRRTRTPEPPAVGLARAKLTDWLRNKAPQRPAGNPPAEHEIEAFGREVETYLHTREELTRGYLSEWGQHTHAYDPARADVPIAEDPPTRAEVQAVLPERWALIDFWQTSDNEFHAFVLTRDEFRVEKLPFPVERLAPRLEQTAQDVRRVGWREPQLGGLDDLGEHLFAPLLPLLRERGIEGLYLVPHEFLHLFPLHAAVTGQGKDGRPKYLCDEFAVAYLPSANMLPWLPKPDPTGRPFVLANPEHGTRHSLPFAHWEGQQLRAQLAVPPDRFFLGPKGTFAATEKWADCGFVHFSCHGSGDDRFAPRSHLRLTDDLLLGHDVLHRRPELRKGAVVVLNGCQTNAPDWRAVNEGMGLMTPFLLRGAGVVFGTQWSVMDMCAADMVLTFAQAVRAPGGSPAAALKSAQSQLRRTSPHDMLARLDGVAGRFPAGSVEQGKVLEQRAWLALRAGRYADARATAARCAAPLRDAGLRADADELTETAERAEKEGLPDWFQRVQFDSPVFWAAFQLVGRVA